MSDVLRALVVDDDEALRALTAEVLSHEGWEVVQESVGSVVPRRVKEEPYHLLLVDQRLPDADGIELVETVRTSGYTGPAIVITGYPTVEDAINALGCAATDYLCKPVAAADLVRISRRARARAHSAQDWEYLWSTLSKRYGFRNVMSCDEATRQCYITAARVADSRATVLVEGETGTGKEYLARAIHYMSRRRDAPFIALNCGAIPDTLLESELFGHEKGAFTSATALKKGICELADGGTLLLDEVGELSPNAQVKLLRFLQDRTITRLGGTKPIEVDVRVIAATNRDLFSMVQAGRFREDLYYRIAVITLCLPPLRERKKDIPPFGHHFLEQVRREVPHAPEEFDPAAMALLTAHDWPGNLRELNNAVQRAALLARGPLIMPQHVQLDGRHGSGRFRGVGPGGAVVAAGC